jgi:hypothetical protein
MKKYTFMLLTLIICLLPEHASTKYHAPGTFKYVYKNQAKRDALVGQIKSTEKEIQKHKRELDRLKRSQGSLREKEEVFLDQLIEFYLKVDPFSWTSWQYNWSHSPICGEYSEGDMERRFERDFVPDFSYAAVCKFSKNYVAPPDRFGRDNKYPRPENNDDWKCETIQDLEDAGIKCEEIFNNMYRQRSDRNYQILEKFHDKLESFLLGQVEAFRARH